MPKKVRNEEVARHLIKNACVVKLKKIKKYEQQFLTLKGKLVTKTFNYIILYTFFFFKNDLVCRGSRKC